MNEVQQKEIRELEDRNLILNYENNDVLKKLLAVVAIATGTIVVINYILPAEGPEGYEMIYQYVINLLASAAAIGGSLWEIKRTTNERVEEILLNKKKIEKLENDL